MLCMGKYFIFMAHFCIPYQIWYRGINTRKNEVNINRRERQQDKVIRHPRPRGCSYVSGNSSILILRVPRHEYKRSFVTKTQNQKLWKRKPRMLPSFWLWNLSRKLKAYRRSWKPVKALGFYYEITLTGWQYWNNSSLVRTWQAHNQKKN